MIKELKDREVARIGRYNKDLLFGINLFFPNKIVEVLINIKKFCLL